jgi:hypothetical protein
LSVRPATYYGPLLMTRTKSEITIRDPALHLMLLDEVLQVRDKDAPIESLRAAYEKYLKRAKIKGDDWDVIARQDDYNVHEAFQSFALQLSMRKAELASLRSLFIDGDHGILSWIHPGFADCRMFYVRSLSGIEHCAALEFLDLGLVRDCSLEPIAALGSLKKINVWWPDDLTEPDALLKLPKLEELEVANLSRAKRKRPWQAVMKELRAHAVEVVGLD